MDQQTKASSSSSLKGGRRSERGYIYLFGVAASTAGLAVGTLDATGITTRAGSITNGAIYTSAYLAILLITRAIVVPQTARISARFGIRRAYQLTIALGSLTWGIAGALILAGLPGLPVLLAFAALFGVSSGFSATLAPIFSKAYIAGKDMAGAYAWMSVIAGIAWALGSVGGGFLLNTAAPGVGLLIKAALGVPLLVVLVRITPATEPHTPRARKRAWADMRDRLLGNAQLRYATILGCGVALFAAPLVSLIVPIVDALRQSPLLPGAGILMAAMALGQLSSPYIVSKFSTERSLLKAAAIASICCAAMLGADAVAALFFSDKPELVVWSVIGFGFGGMRFAARALNIGAVTASGSDESAANLISAFTFATALSSPVGVLIWGVMINRISPEAAIAFGAAGTAVVSIASLVAARRRSTQPV